MMIAGWMFDERPPTADIRFAPSIQKCSTRAGTLTLIAKRTFRF
jgi:hypothetical protein